MLDDDERALFALVAGGRVPPLKRVRELWCGPIGRRSGKSRMAAAVAVHIALLTDLHTRLAAGEIGTVAVISASREQSQTVFNYVRGFLTVSPLCISRNRRASAVMKKGQLQRSESDGCNPAR